MTTVLETNANPSVSSSVSSMQEIPLTHIQELKTNPRRQFDETKLAELADNIRQHGVLQPVLVRPFPDGEAGFYELAAGARRFRASTLAKKETIPACVREITDAECLELQLIENLQSADVHELDEARGYATLMLLQPETYTVETLAEKIGRSEKYVHARLRLVHLVADAQEAFYIGRVRRFRAVRSSAFALKGFRSNGKRMSIFLIHAMTLSSLRSVSVRTPSCIRRVLMKLSAT